MNDTVAETATTHSLKLHDNKRLMLPDHSDNLSFAVGFCFSRLGDTFPLTKLLIRGKTSTALEQHVQVTLAD